MNDSHKPPWRPTGSCPMSKGQVPTRKPLVGAVYGTSKSCHSGWASNPQSPGIHWGVATARGGQPLWSPYNPWGSWDPYSSTKASEIPSAHNRLATLPRRGAPAPAALPTESLLDMVKRAAQPMQGCSVEEETARMRGDLSKMVESLSQHLGNITDTLEGRVDDRRPLGGAIELEVDGKDVTRQRRREIEEDRLRMNTARESLQRQRRILVGNAGDSGFGLPDPGADPNKVPTAASDEDVAATMLLLGCLCEVVDARRERIFPPSHHYLTQEHRTVLDFLDGTCIDRSDKTNKPTSENAADGADATLKPDAGADGTLEDGDQTLKPEDLEQDGTSPAEGDEVLEDDSKSAAEDGEKTQDDSSKPAEDDEKPEEDGNKSAEDSTKAAEGS